jgi:hypothetical protein
MAYSSTLKMEVTYSTPNMSLYPRRYNSSTTGKRKLNPSEFQYLFLIVTSHHIMAVLIFTASVGEYKASLYALMTYSHQGDLKAAEPVARYLFYRSHLLDRHTEVRRDGFTAVSPKHKIVSQLFSSSLTTSIEQITFLVLFIIILHFKQ